MSALEFRWAKGWGRIEMPGGSVSFSCLGRPFMRVCRKCEKDVRKIWEGAL